VSAGPHRWARRGLLLLLAAQALVGLFWLARNLGDVPEYNDTLDYIRCSRSLEVPGYRGVAYPLFLAAIDRLVGGEDLEVADEASADEHPGAGRVKQGRADRRLPGNAFVPNPRSRQALVVQLVQLVLVAGSLTYFLRVFVAPLGGSRTHAALGGLLVWLLLADPLVGHLQLAVLTDGLTLSASLVACAALVRLLFGERQRVLHAAALFLSVLLASTLRVEKVWVLAGTLLGSLAFWWLTERRRDASARALSSARALQVACIALAAVLAALAAQRAFRGEGKRLPAYDFILDQRILFPHLVAVYPELPAEFRAAMSEDEARAHDEDVVFAWRGIEGVGGGDPELRRSLLESAARVVLRERWPWIVMDVFKDVAESVAVSYSFYGHLGALACLGRQEYGIIRADYNRWTYQQMSLYHPGTTRLYLALSGLSLLVCSVLALAHARRSRAEDSARIEPARRQAWVPIGVFVLVNALAFALTTGLVHPRYAVFAHVALLALVYRGALGWAAQPGTPGSSPALFSSPIRERGRTSEDGAGLEPGAPG